MFRHITIILAFLFVYVISSPSWGEGISFDDLVRREGIYYKKFTDVPFTGELTEGLDRGHYKNGKREGSWTGFHDNGQLRFKGDYKKDKREGSWVSYWDSGQISEKGDYKNGRQVGLWTSYLFQGEFWKEGSYKSGKSHGPWVYYWSNGQLDIAGSFNNGKMEGSWVGFNRDGTVNEKYTGTFKDGKLID